MKYAYRIHFSLVTSALALTAFVLAPVGSAEAKMKAKYYKECYASVEEARELVPEPKADVAGTANKLGSAAGALGKIGGFGGLGGLGKVASTAATVQQYSGYVASAAALTEQMQNQYPDPADRILAYGEQLGDDANNVLEGAEHLDKAQVCYDEAYTQLVADFEGGEIKKRAAKKQHKEIQKGMIEINMVLADAQQVMDNNLQNYNEALTTETSGMGLNLGTLAQAASVAKGVSSVTGGGGDGVCVHGFAACQRRAAALRARAAGGWGGLYTASDPMGAAPAPPAGMSYSQFGIMNDLSMLGSMNAIGMSGGAAAMVGSQVGVGAIQSAINNRNNPTEVASAAPQAAAAPAVVPVEQQVSPQMLSSLQAAGVNSQKYMDTYGQIALTTEKQFEVSSKVGQKAGW